MSVYDHIHHEGRTSVSREEYPQPIIMVQRRRMTPVQYVADGFITLRPAANARTLRKSGAVEWLSPEDWERIRNNSTGFNLDPAYA